VKIQHLTTGVCWAVLLHSSAQQILIAAISLEDDQQFQGCFANRAVIVILNCRAHSVPENWQGTLCKQLKQENMLDMEYLACITYHQP
jgi:hypothetical protein